MIKSATINHINRAIGTAFNEFGLQNRACKIIALLFFHSNVCKYLDTTINHFILKSEVDYEEQNTFILVTIMSKLNLK